MPRPPPSCNYRTSSLSWVDNWNSSRSLDLKWNQEMTKKTNPISKVDYLGWHISSQRMLQLLSLAGRFSHWSNGSSRKRKVLTNLVFEICKRNIFSITVLIPPAGVLPLSHMIIILSNVQLAPLTLSPHLIMSLMYKCTLRQPSPEDDAGQD